MDSETSFLTQVRGEIVRSHPHRCCRRYMLAALLEAAKNYRVYGGPVLRFASAQTAHFTMKLLRSFELEFLWTYSGESNKRKNLDKGGRDEGEQGPGNGDGYAGEAKREIRGGRKAKSRDEGETDTFKSYYAIKLVALPKLGKVRRCLNCMDDRLLNLGEVDGDLNFSLPSGRNLVFKLCCRRHWLAGLFLVFGSVDSPRQDYRLEWKLPRESLAKQVEICLRLEHLIPIVSRRGRNWVVSLKKAEEATEALSVIQAHLSRLNFEEIRALKETRNEVGRRVNAESANMARASLAAVRQIGCLRLLEREGVLSNLPEDLQRVARIRMDNPEAALRELTELFDPPLSKSTLNRRLKKLEDISREYGSPIFE